MNKFLTIAFVISWFISYGQGIQLDNVFLTSDTGSEMVITSGNVSNFGSSQLLNNGTITIDGNFNNNGTSTIDNGGTIYIDGNWSNLSLNNVFTNRDDLGLVVLNGNSNQTVSGTTTRFENLTINNSTVGSAITLASNQIIENTASLTNGVISTGSNFLILESTTGSDLTDYSDACFVNGNLRRYIGNNTNTYGLPVGDGTANSDYHLAEIINGNLAGAGFSYIDAKFGSLQSGGILSLSEEGTPYIDICNDGVWYITPNSAPGSGDYDLKLYITNFNCNIVDNQFAILSRSDGSSNAADWNCTPCGFGDPGINSNGGEGRVIADNFALRLGFTNFSQMGLGLTDQPLPIELLSFTAVPKNNNVFLEWVTKSEYNNDKFIIERSMTGREWEEIIEQDAVSYSNTNSYYSAVDHSPYPGISFYKLKQIDFDGNYRYSEIQNVYFSDRSDQSISIYPNPTSNYISIEGSLQDITHFQLFNNMGQNVTSMIRILEKTNGKILIDLGRLSPGIYNFKTSSTVKTIYKN